MQTCVHRVYSDPDRDSYTDGVSCGRPAVAFSIHPATKEKMFWCVRHAGEHGDARLIESGCPECGNGIHGKDALCDHCYKLYLGQHYGSHSDAQEIDTRSLIEIEVSRLEAALKVAEEAFENAIDRDAPDETVRRLEVERNQAAYRLKMIVRLHKSEEG